MNSLAQRLQTAIADEEPRLRAIPETSAATPQAPGAWTGKQELGHLIDSATNNRARFINAALQGEFGGPSYDGEGWVRLGGYDEMPWNAVIDLWRALNRALIAVVERIPAERFAAPCRIGDAKPVTLEFVIDDYILHMQHHLDHILSREHPTAYPGAAIGV